MFQHKFRPSEVVLVGQKEHKKGNYDLLLLLLEKTSNFCPVLVFCPS